MLRLWVLIKMLLYNNYHFVFVSALWMNPYQKAHIYQWHKYKKLDRLLIIASTIRSFNSYIYRLLYFSNHDGIAALQSHYRKNYLNFFLVCHKTFLFDKSMGNDYDFMNVIWVIFEYVKGMILNVIINLQYMQIYRQMRSKSTRL